MARVDRMVTLGVWMLADTDKVPVWNAKLPDTAPYIAAAAKLHPSAGAAAGEAHDQPRFSDFNDRSIKSRRASRGGLPCLRTSYICAVIGISTDSRRAKSTAA